MRPSLSVAVRSALCSSRYSATVGLKLQQALARRQTALASSPVQRRARRHLAVDWHAGCDESHDELGVVGLGCIAKVLVRHGS